MLRVPFVLLFYDLLTGKTKKQKLFQTAVAGQAFKSLLCFCMRLRTSSRPIFFSALVTKYCGRNCQVFFSSSEKACTFRLTTPGFSLSDLVKAMANGTSHLSSFRRNSRSFFCGGCRLSISTNTFTRFSLLSM